MSFFRVALAIFYKDLLIEKRTKESLSVMLVFSVLVIVVFNFAFVGRLDIGAGVLWIAFAFSGILGLNRAFVSEKENDALQGLMLIPVDRGAIYIGKFFGNFLFMFVMELIILPVFGILYNFDLTTIVFPMILICALGTWGFNSVGTIYAAISANTKMREVMLPILVFPVIIPVIVASVESTAALMDGAALAEVFQWLQLLAAFDVISIVVATLTFEYILED